MLLELFYYCLKFKPNSHLPHIQTSLVKPYISNIVATILCHSVNSSSQVPNISKMRVTIAIYLASILVMGVYGNTDNKDVQDVGRQPKLGFLGGGTNTLAQLAQDIFSRSTSSSQVLSLNLTNLVILFVVKALIFGAGSLGFGGFDHLGRSIDDNNTNLIENQAIVTESDLLLMLSYLKGDMTHKYDCLNYAACKDPRKAKDYLNASSFLMKGVNFFNLSTESSKYEKMLENVNEAIHFGAKGYDCSTKFSCENSFS